MSSRLVLQVRNTKFLGICCQPQETGAYPGPFGEKQGQAHWVSLRLSFRPRRGRTIYGGKGLFDTPNSVVVSDLALFIPFICCLINKGHCQLVEVLPLLIFVDLRTRGNFSGKQSKQTMSTSKQFLTLKYVDLILGLSNRDMFPGIEEEAIHRVLKAHKGVKTMCHTY